ncbi:MAG: hypothetical protein [Microviridae sp.]|nr:MAG: hypothetical protein [Microviridae sp.]
MALRSTYAYGGSKTSAPLRQHERPPLELSKAHRKTHFRMSWQSEHRGTHSAKPVSARAHEAHVGTENGETAETGRKHKRGIIRFRTTRPHDQRSTSTLGIGSGYITKTAHSASYAVRASPKSEKKPRRLINTGRSMTSTPADRTAPLTERRPDQASRLPRVGTRYLRRKTPQKRSPDALAITSPLLANRPRNARHKGIEANRHRRGRRGIRQDQE